MDFDTKTKLAIYGYFAKTGGRPTPEDVANLTGSEIGEVLGAYARLRAQKVLALEPDGLSIRMAPPFSGVPTQHLVVIGERRYFANCAWDALGVVAALHQSSEVHSRCEQSGEPLYLKVGPDGPEPSTWLFHSLVPAARWWDDIVFT